MLGVQISGGFRFSSASKHCPKGSTGRGRRAGQCDPARVREMRNADFGLRIDEEQVLFQSAIRIRIRILPSGLLQRSLKGSPSASRRVRPSAARDGRADVGHANLAEVAAPPDARARSEKKRGIRASSQVAVRAALLVVGHGLARQVAAEAVPSDASSISAACVPPKPIRASCRIEHVEQSALAPRAFTVAVLVPLKSLKAARAGVSASTSFGSRSITAHDPLVT